MKLFIVVSHENPDYMEDSWRPYHYFKNGTIVRRTNEKRLYESNGKEQYLMNHHVRSIPCSKVSLRKFAKQRTRLAH